MAECAKGVYRPRRPRETAFYRLVEEHYERFEQVYPERYEDRYGFFRPVIRETVYKYLGCGDLKQGFARVRCRDCGHEYLLAYFCKGRYFCTSCHTKRAVAFGADDATGRERLARYLIRAPFSMNKIRYDTAAKTVIYKTKMVVGPNRNFEISDPLDFLAAVTCHIPNRGDHLMRYYGYYSSVQRGRR
jgi:ribosomal protein S27E